MRRMAAFLIASGLAVSASASLTVEEVVSHLESTETAMKAVQFNFQQTVTFSGTGQVAEVTGEGLFGKGGKFRITKNQPEEQITISNGTKVWVYTPAYQQVWEGSARRWMDSPAIPKGLVPLDGYVEDLKKNFKLEVAPGTDDDSILLKAVPKQADAGYTMVLTVSTRTWIPVRTEFKSETANIETVMSDIVMNPAVKKSAFQFDAPKGVDVIPLN